MARIGQIIYQGSRFYLADNLFLFFLLFNLRWAQFYVSLCFVTTPYQKSKHWRKLLCGLSSSFCSACSLDPCMILGDHSLCWHNRGGTFSLCTYVCCQCIFWDQHCQKCKNWNRHSFLSHCLVFQPNQFQVERCHCSLSNPQIDRAWPRICSRLLNSSPAASNKHLNIWKMLFTISPLDHRKPIQMIHWENNKSGCKFYQRR